MDVNGKKRIVFVVGGSYGFSEHVYQRGNEKNIFIKNDFLSPNGGLFLWNNCTEDIVF